MTFIVDGTNGLTFPDSTTQTKGLPAPSTSGNVLRSDGTNWTTSASSEVGVGQTWQNVLASRAAATTYTNSTGRPIKVLFTVTSATTTVTGTVNGFTITIGAGAGAYYNIAHYFAVIPDGNTYSISAFPGGNQTWLELR